MGEERSATDLDGVGAPSVEAGRAERVDDLPKESGCEPGDDGSGRRVFAGIDEAGLGPLLGPLNVGAAVISAPASWAASHPTPSVVPGHPDWWKVLDAVVSADPKDARRTVICDSKKLHKPSSIRPLEESVLTLAAALTNAADPEAAPRVPATFAAFVEQVALLSSERWAAVPWYAADRFAAERLPLAALPDRLEVRAIAWRKALATLDLRLEGVRVRPVLAGELNELIERSGNKASAHFVTIGRMLQKLWERYPRLHVVVDRQGGRDFYGELLGAQFPDAALEVVAEATPIPGADPKRGAAQKSRKPTATTGGKRARGGGAFQETDPTPRFSRYRLRDGSRLLDVTFITDGERASLLVSVASLFAKFLREGCMRALNTYWSEHAPGIKPTKGYVQDGRRFLADLEAACPSELARHRAILVRNR